MSSSSQSSWYLFLTVTSVVLAAFATFFCDLFSPHCTLAMYIPAAAMLVGSRPLVSSFSDACFRISSALNWTLFVSPSWLQNLGTYSSGFAGSSIIPSSLAMYRYARPISFLDTLADSDISSSVLGILFCRQLMYSTDPTIASIERPFTRPFSAILRYIIDASSLTLFGMLSCDAIRFSSPRASARSLSFESLNFDCLCHFLSL